MADGRKHDDIKIIKNPLLSQSLLLEELSGVSLIVPAPSQKTQSIEAYGSKTGVDVPPLGEKKHGSPISQEKGGIKDVPQSSLPFTDIPLNVADSKTSSNEKSIPPAQGSNFQTRKEAEPGLFKSSAASLLSLLVPPAPLNPPNEAKEGTCTTLGKGVQSGPKRQSSPQTFEPQLIPPISESKINSATLSFGSKPPVKPDLSSPTNTKSELTAIIKPSEKLYSPEPPRIPLPSVQNNTTLKNPYALRNVHNISNVPRLSKSPPSSLGTSDCIPLYTTQNVSTLPPNLYSFFSGPPVATSGSSDTFPAEPKANVFSVQTESLNSTNRELDVPVSAPETKPVTHIQSSVPEQKPAITIPPTPSNMKIFSPQTASFNTYHNQSPETRASETVMNVSLNQSVYPAQNIFTSTVNQEFNNQQSLPVIKTDLGIENIVPKPSASTYDSSVIHSANYPIQAGGQIFPHEKSNEQTQMPGLEVHGDIPSQMPKTTAPEPLNNVPMNQSVYSAQTMFTGPVNKELNIHHVETASKPPMKVQKTVSIKADPTNESFTSQFIPNTFIETNIPEPEPASLIPAGSTISLSSSEFQNKLLQETYKNIENIPIQNHPPDIGPSTPGKSEIKVPDGFFPPSTTVNFKQSSIFQPEKSPSDPLIIQSKQVNINNIPLSETQNAETNSVVSKDSFVGNSSLSHQPGKMQVTKLPSLSAFFDNSHIDTKSVPTENMLQFVSNSTSQPVSDILSPSTYFQQAPSSIGWNQSKPSVTTPASSENIPKTHPVIETNDHVLLSSSTVIPNSGVTLDSHKTSPLQNQPILTSDPKLPVAAATTTPLASDSTTKSMESDNSAPSAPPLYPQPLYTFPKLNSDSSMYPLSKQEIMQPFSSVPPSMEKVNPAIINPLVPTFNFFSSHQTSCLPPPLDQPLPKTSAPCQTPASSYYFKPIQTPESVSDSFLSQSSVPTSIQSPHQVVNPTPSAPPKTFNFPPPNVCYPKGIPSTVKELNNAEIAPPLPDTEHQSCLDGEELDQIPLEGSSVLLFNPETINRKKKIDSPVSGNTFRLSGGIKKRTYAPVPDLGVTERRNCPPPTSPSGQSASSQEEMAAIHENQNQNNAISTAKTPESAMVVDNYFGNEPYRPPYHHWFYKSGRDNKSPWTPFSMADSLNLEQVFTSSELHEDTKVSTDGGRYDVEILKRKKISVYWDEPAGEVRRCSWFVKSVSDSRYAPYDENIAALLEDEFKQGCETNEWNRKLELADGEVIILHGPSAIAHHVRSPSPDSWSTQPALAASNITYINVSIWAVGLHLIRAYVNPLQQKSRVVKRGVEEFDIPKGEPKQVDHLLLVVHGIGKACDLRFRSLVDVVDDFRSISLQLVQSHFNSGVQNGNIGRVEVLPVEWHKALHTETIDDRLSAITLPSIPRAREFTNETLLDILFYTSPVFCEKIVQAVGEELNRVFALYQKRNPGFRGQVSLGGHSLGSLILFDMLCHQKPVEKAHVVSPRSSVIEDDEEMDEVGFMRKARLNRRMSYLTIGPGAGQPYTIYPQLLFQPKAFFALGSPIGMFITVRGVETLGEDFKFPTCPAFFNIFHPNDPVAYRIEALIKPELAKVPAVLIPHHKGRKRMHLELKETMAHVTAALKQKLVDSMKNTWNAVYQLAMFNRKDHNLQGEVNKVIEDEVLRDTSYLERDPPIGIVGEEDVGNELRVGKLNDGRRIDYVLQEAPLETFNQYISAIRSHLVYWESEDTMLMILKEIYAQMGISPDSQVPQPILPFDISGDSETYSEYTYSIGAPPTQFVRK